MCTSNEKYPKLNFTGLLGLYNKIVIPMIQRDYAQGRDDKKSTDIRENLLNDIFSDKEEIDFDLIFGSREMHEGKECFVPVDGQQRLTTLFLLYLYNEKFNGKKVEKGLNKFTYETRRAATDFCKAIVEKDWNVSTDKEQPISESLKDANWFMVYWNNDPTVISMLRMLDTISNKAPKKDFSDKLNRVKFRFFDLKQHGLNETLYLKMNSRGKPLTAFENLKASIDNILPNSLSVDCFKDMDKNDCIGDNFKEKWQYCIDRKWADTFWDKEKPYNLDKNMTRFIVRFLSAYYATKHKDDEVTEVLKEINSTERYDSFIPFAPIKDTLTDESFILLAQAFSVLSSKSKEEKLHPYWDKDKDFTVDEKSEYKPLAVLFAYVLLGGQDEIMRFAWNMSENTARGYDNFIALCRRFQEIKEDANFKDGIYQVLSKHKFDNPSEQLAEEIEKAKQILNPKEAQLPNKPEDWDYNKEWNWRTAIIEAENFAFFKGAIAFLFNNEDGNIDWSCFDEKMKTARLLFDKEGVQKDQRVKALHTLYSYCDDFDSQFWWNAKIFNCTANTWKKNILTKVNSYNNIYAKPVHHLLMKHDLSDETKPDSRLQLLANESFVKFLVTENENNKDMYIRDPHNALYYCGRKYGVMLDPEIHKMRDSYLNQLLDNGKIELTDRNRRIADTKLFWGEFDINFIYHAPNGKDLHLQWYRQRNSNTYDIYLMTKDWDYIKRKIKLENEQGDRQNYYCFNVEEPTNNNSDIEHFCLQVETEFKEFIENNNI